jgi:hypothetical protein
MFTWQVTTKNTTGTIEWCCCLSKMVEQNWI